MILLTGGAGFIGSTLALHLVRKNRNVRVLDSLRYTGESLIPASEGIEFIKGDIRSPDNCIDALAGVKVVIHLGAIVGEQACAKDETLARETNLYATRQLWELAKDCGVDTFIFASTCSNYGNAILATEETDLKPLGLYSETKVNAEKWILEHSESKMFTSILRFATAFGISPRTRMDLIVNQFVVDAYLQKRLSVYNPISRRPYCHVSDIGRAIMLVVDRLRTRENNNSIFNIGGFNRTKIQIAESVKEWMPCIDIETVETSGGRDYAVDFSKIRSRGFCAYISPEAGIREMVNALPLFDDLLARKWVNA